MNLNILTLKSQRSTTPSDQPSDQVAVQPEPPNSSSGIGERATNAGSVTSPSSSSCVEACCQDIETGKAQQLVIDKKETARTFGQRERYFNAEWYKGREWLILCTSKKRAFCEICRFAAVKQLVTFSKCGDDGFVKTGINNWKKCPGLLDSHENSLFHEECVQKKCAYLSQTPINIQLDKQVRTDQIKRREGLMEQLRCLQFLARKGLAVIQIKRAISKGWLNS